MNTVQRIAKNTAVLLAATIISKVLGFFYVMYTARYLGEEGFGILSFALAFTGIFGVFSDLGLGSLTVREVARDKSLAKKYLDNISVIKAILVAITFALIAMVINLLGYPEQTIKVVYLISLSVIFNSFTEMFYSIFRAFEKMEYSSLGQILNSILMLVGADRVVFPERDLGIKLANNLSFSLIEFIQVTEKFAITKIPAQKNFVGKTISELQLKKSRQVSCIGVDKEGEINLISPDYIIQEKDELFFAGKNDKLAELAKETIPSE